MQALAILDGALVEFRVQGFEIEGWMSLGLRLSGFGLNSGIAMPSKCVCAGAICGYFALSGGGGTCRVYTDVFDYVELTTPISCQEAKGGESTGIAT